MQIDPIQELSLVLNTYGGDEVLAAFEQLLPTSPVRRTCLGTVLRLIAALGLEGAKTHIDKAREIDGFQRRGFAALSAAVEALSREIAALSAATAEARTRDTAAPKKPKGEARPETRMPESIRPAPKNPIPSSMDRAAWVNALSDGRGVAMAERTEEEVLAAIQAEKSGAPDPSTLFSVRGEGKGRRYTLLDKMEEMLRTLSTSEIVRQVPSLEYERVQMWQKARGVPPEIRNSRRTT